ncbi:MAG: hypothetical protein HC809_08745 [Gammaproteobacteria bacterium]|nr:hypothetical protein [Gammaproteobacteria bacterium]
MKAAYATCTRDARPTQSERSEDALAEIHARLERLTTTIEELKALRRH